MFINDILKDFQIIPKSLILSKDLSDRAKVVYCYLSMQDNNWTYTQADISTNMNFSYTTIKNAIAELFDNGWLEYVIGADGQKVLNLKTSRFVEEPRCGGIGKNIQEETEEEKLTRKQDEELFNKCWKLYLRKGVKKPARAQWDKLTPDDKAKVEVHIPYYIESCSDRVYQKDFERYLKHRLFENVVYKDNVVLFDPDAEKERSNTYLPRIDGHNLRWDNKRSIYISLFALPMLVDGYTKETRPNDATVAYQGKVYKWSASDKGWVFFGYLI